jgi:hypothetical protein
MAYTDEVFDDDEPTTKVSKINAAALINLILADLWRNCYRHAANGAYSKWNAELNNIWTELGGDIDEETDDGKAILAKFEDLEVELANSGSLIKPKANGFEEVSQSEKINCAKQYRVLLKKAMFLKRLQNKQGKGTAYLDDTDSYMD